MRTRVKICGITTPEDALTAVRLGADAIGLVFYSPSPRCVSLAKAAEIVGRLPPFITVVGLFVNAERAAITATLRAVRIDLIQFHGDESPEHCASHDRPWIKAVRMRADVDLVRIKQDYVAASGLLLDAYRPGVPGGTGAVFDWQRIPRDLAADVVLAGGLTPENVAEAVRTVGPYAVDVSGGVEAGPGKKDAGKIEEFIRGVRFGEQQDRSD